MLNLHYQKNQCTLNILKIDQTNEDIGDCWYFTKRG